MLGGDGVAVPPWPPEVYARRFREGTVPLSDTNTVIGSYIDDYKSKIQWTPAPEDRAPPSPVDSERPVGPSRDTNDRRLVVTDDREINLHFILDRDVSLVPIRIHFYHGHTERGGLQRSYQLNVAPPNYPPQLVLKSSANSPLDILAAVAQQALDEETKNQVERTGDETSEVPDEDDGDDALSELTELTDLSDGESELESVEYESESEFEPESEEEPQFGPKIKFKFTPNLTTSGPEIKSTPNPTTSGLKIKFTPNLTTYEPKIKNPRTFKPKIKSTPKLTTPRRKIKSIRKLATSRPKVKVTSNLATAVKSNSKSNPMASNQMEREWPCLFKGCDYKRGTPWPDRDRQRHINTHYEQHYPCPVCGMMLSRVDALVRHVKGHTAEQRAAVDPEELEAARNTLPVWINDVAELVTPAPDDPIRGFFYMHSSIEKTDPNWEKFCKMPPGMEDRR